MKNVPQKQAFRFIGWPVAQDFCGWQPSIRTEEGCYSIWRLTIQRLNLLVKLVQTRKIKLNRTQALQTRQSFHSQGYNSNLDPKQKMLKPKPKRTNTAKKRKSGKSKEQIGN